MKKRIMLLGDSVRMFYTDKVKNKLGSDYEVWAPNENGRFAKYTLNTLRHWIPEFPEPDVIHWNNGLWDVGVFYEDEGCFTGIDEYIETLGRILCQLKKTNAKIIFATTTPVRPEKAFLSPTNHAIHRNSDIELYNKHAVEFMKNNDVTVNDLYSLISNDLYKYVGNGDTDIIHPSALGVDVLSDAVASCIIDVCRDLKTTLKNQKSPKAQKTVLDEMHMQ